jgi:putative transposase
MKKSKFSEEQIAYALRQAEAGTKVEEICRQLGVSQATFFSWKKKFGNRGVTELRRLRQLEEENAQLKKLVADLSLDRQMLQDVIKKSSEAKGEKGTGWLYHDGIPGVHQASLYYLADATLGVLLQATQAR